MIAFGVLVSSMGSSMVWPFQFIYISRVLGLNLSTVATLITLSAGAGLVVSFLGGSVADRFGRKPVMVLAQMSHGTAWVLMSLAGSYVGFLVPLTLISAAQPFYAVGSDAMMADLLPPEKRPSGYSVLRMFNNAGIALGPALGGFMVAHSYTAAFRTAAAAMIGYGLFLLLGVRETLPKCDRKCRQARAARGEALGGYGRVLRDKGYVVFALTLALGMIAPQIMWTLLAVYTKTNFNLPEYLYSWLPITNALMCVFVQYFVTLYTRRREPLAMLTLGMLVYAVGVGSVALMGGFFGFWVSMAVFSLGELMVVPTGTTYVANRAPAAYRGRYMSVYWMTWGTARALAPLVGGLLNDHISPRSVWIGGFAIGLASTVGLFLLGRSRALAGAAEPGAEALPGSPGGRG